MSIKREQLIFIKCSAVFSLISAIIVTTSLVTDYWIIGSVTAKNDSIAELLSINHGLYEGFLQRRFVDSSRTNNIYLTCLWERNVCMWSSQPNKWFRKKEVIRLLNYQQPIPCVICSLESSSTNVLDKTTGKSTRQFLNSKMFMTSIIFVVLTMVFLYMCSILALVNCYMSPTINILNINGIISCSGLAFVSNFIGLIIFGCNFNNWIKENVGIIETIIGDYKSSAILGYSYWFFLLTCILSSIPMVLLHARKMILMQSQATIVVAKPNNPMATLY